MIDDDSTKRRDVVKGAATLGVVGLAGCSGGGDGGEGSSGDGGDGGDDGTPIDEEQGKVGGTPSDGATLRHLCEQAKENGVGRGAPLLDYVEDEGYSGPAARVSEVAEEVFDG